MNHSTNSLKKTETPSWAISATHAKERSTKLFLENWMFHVYATDEGQCWTSDVRSE